MFEVAKGFGSANAVADFTNSGTINLDANANAIALAGTGTATNAGGFAHASAHERTAVVEGAVAFGSGNASANLTNSGTINIIAAATASGTGAFAHGHVYNGIFETAFASGNGNAAATFDNSGAINIAGVAHAVATVNTASAQGRIIGATTGGTVPQIGQLVVAHAGGNASASMTNSGSISVIGSAVATGVKGGFATAENIDAVGQRVFATSGAGSANLTNSGTMTIAAIAKGNATGQATAHALLEQAVQQDIFAGNGSATGSITNSNSIVIAAQATAHGNGSIGTLHVGTGATATTITYPIGVGASATANIGVIQRDHAINGPASASLVNSGTLSVSAIANATGAGATATQHVGVGTHRSNLDHQRRHLFACEGQGGHRSGRDCRWIGRSWSGCDCDEGSGECDRGDDQ